MSRFIDIAQTVTEPTSYNEEAGLIVLTKTVIEEVAVVEKAAAIIVVAGTTNCHL